MKKLLLIGAICFGLHGCSTEEEIENIDDLEFEFTQKENRALPTLLVKNFDTGDSLTVELEMVNHNVDEEVVFTMDYDSIYTDSIDGVKSYDFKDYDFSFGFEKPEYKECWSAKIVKVSNFDNSYSLDKTIKICSGE